MNKVIPLIGLANAAGNTEEAIARNSQNYRSELQAITSELLQIPQPKIPHPENHQVKGKYWGINKVKSNKSFKNASNKYTANSRNYMNKTRNLRTRRNNITAKSLCIGKRSMVQRRKKNMPSYEPVKQQANNQASESMIAEFKKYGYDYYPSTKGYMAGPQNYVQGKPAYFEYRLSKTVGTRNNKNNGWSFNGESTHTELKIVLAIRLL